MGSPSTNFYNDAYSRGGFEEAARRVQELWVNKERDQAIAAVPDELILQTNFLGSTSEVTERVRAYRDAGVTVLRVQPEGLDTQERLNSLGQVVDIVRGLNGDSSG
jgi:alkanesulfonate monooxygenase SsuD/methylene tetrahydromethanopterin reductase-like flavin-dependent oxidoreductase (luciferase family)